MENQTIVKMSEVIRFIEAHLKEKLDLDQIASATHYSKFHLHRMFTNTVGLTIQTYVKRRRLTEAAKLLVFSDKSIIEIAAEAGYESQQAFTHIFTELYKQSPNKFRENEKFYPLQLTFRLEGNYRMLQTNEKKQWNITFASEEDIPCWMELVRHVVDGFPHLYENEYEAELIRRIVRKQALILKDIPCSEAVTNEEGSALAVGIMLFSYETGSIDFMGTHPLYRNKGIPRAFLDKVMGELLNGIDLSTTTFREGDKADTGHRKELKELGFAEAELLVEFGYPTQRFFLLREGEHGK